MRGQGKARKIKWQIGGEKTEVAKRKARFGREKRVSGKGADAGKYSSLAIFLTCNLRTYM